MQYNSKPNKQRRHFVDVDEEPEFRRLSQMRISQEPMTAAEVQMYNDFLRRHGRAGEAEDDMLRDPRDHILRRDGKRERDAKRS